MFLLLSCSQKSNKIDKHSSKELTQSINIERVDSNQTEQRVSVSKVNLFQKISTDTLKILDSLLLPLYNINNSKNISKTRQGKKIIRYGKKVLPALSQYFTDTALTKIKSDCHNFYLNKGEVAIILADKIEGMPYMYLTHIQNCTMEFCKGNSNLIEFYFGAIRRDNVKFFQERYIQWLISDDRKKSTAYQTSK